MPKAKKPRSNFSLEPLSPTWAIIRSGLRLSSSSKAVSVASDNTGVPTANESSGDTKQDTSDEAQIESAKLNEYLVTSLDEDGRTGAAATVPSELSFEDFFKQHIITSLEPEGHFPGRCSQGCEVVIAARSWEIILKRDQRSLCDECYSKKQQEVAGRTLERTASEPHDTAQTLAQGSGDTTGPATHVDNSQVSDDPQ